jgi:Cu2+-containing amine oxidase
MQLRHIYVKHLKIAIYVIYQSRAYVEPPDRISLEMIATAPAVVHAHPLDSATSEEIEAATQIIREYYKDMPLHFKAIGLEEPTKALMVKCLEAEHTGQPLPEIPRRIFAM